MIKVIAFDLGDTLLKDNQHISSESQYLVPRFDDDRFIPEAMEFFRTTEVQLKKVIDKVIEECFEIRDRKIFTAFPDYRLAIASNFTSRMRNFLEKQGMVQYFDPIVISAEIGVNKPDPKFFQILAEKIGEESGDILFVDNLQENVDAAEKEGFKVAKYDEGEDLIRTVKTRLSQIGN